MRWGTVMDLYIEQNIQLRLEIVIIFSPSKECKLYYGLPHEYINGSPWRSTINYLGIDMVTDPVNNSSSMSSEEVQIISTEPCKMEIPAFPYDSLCYHTDLYLCVATAAQTSCAYPCQTATIRHPD